MDRCGSGGGGDGVVVMNEVSDDGMMAEAMAICMDVGYEVCIK